MKLFHSQFLTKYVAMTFRFNETKNLATTSFLCGDGKILKRDWLMIRAFTNTKDAVMRKLLFSTGTIGMGFAVADVDRMVARCDAIASDHCVIIGQPCRDAGNLQGSSTS